MLADSPEFDIRYTDPTDETALRKWLEDQAVLNQFPATTPGEINMLVPNWIGFHRFKSSLTALYQGEIIGIGTLLLMPYYKLIHHCLTSVVVDPKHQGQGFGTALVRNLKHLAKDYFHFQMMYAEIYNGSKLETILKKQGFTETLRQEKFVKSDGHYRARILLEVDL